MAKKKKKKAKKPAKKKVKAARKKTGKPKKKVILKKQKRKTKKKPIKKASKEIKKISPSEEVIAEIAGRDVIPLVRFLKNKKNVSEFKLAEAVDEEINTIRNMLYRLYDANLVSFIRKKDKKKGWYIYYWTFNQERVKDLAKKIRHAKIEKLRERLEREKTTTFFTCENKCIRLDFEQAAEFEYKCPECGMILNQEDNSERIAALEKELARMEKEEKTTSAKSRGKRT